MKTYLNSPARRNPSHGPVSSPVRGSIVEPRAASVSKNVRRTLDFSSGSLDANKISPPTSTSPQKKHDVRANPKLIKNAQLGQLKQAFQFKGGDDADEGTSDQVNSDVDAEDGYPMANGGDDEEILEEVSTEEILDEPKAQSPQPTKKRGRPPKAAAVVEEDPVEEAIVPAQAKGRSGRPKKPKVQVQEEPPAKRTRRSLGGAPEAAHITVNNLLKTAVPPLAAKSKHAVKKIKLAPIAESDSPQVQRGPPMPRRNGLVIHRRETPMEGSGFKQTRSGRNSIKPLAFWRNERAEYSDDEFEDSTGKFLMTKIKGVVRVDEIADTKKRTKRSKSSKPRKQREESEDDENTEPWEDEPGRLYGDVMLWDPEDPIGAEPREEREEELALSSAAIITREIENASFRFAKTLTLPFFGSGVVDLPPRSIKNTKPSRKMQMAFFVFTGRVKVIINGTDFRIGKGGMFQVPRGGCDFTF